MDTPTPANAPTPTTATSATCSRASLQLAAIEAHCLPLAILAGLILVLLLAARSFQWHMGEDVGFFHYVSWLVTERHFIPYLDIHETSFPGSFLIYALLGTLGGYSHTGFNLVNVGSVVLTASILFSLLKPLHPRAAWTAATLFCLQYFTLHHSMYLQRDYLAGVCVLLAVRVMVANAGLPLRSVLAGVLFGLASSIKPHAAMGAPLVVLWLAQPQGIARWQDRGQAVLYSLAGFITVWLALLAWLAAQHNLQAFWHMVTEYLPLYQRMNGIHLPLTTAQRLHNAFDWVSGNTLTLCPPVLAALACLRCNGQVTHAQRTLAGLLACLWLVYIVYIGVAGKFWDYHFVPAYLFYSAMFGVLAMPWVAHNWLTFALRVVSLCLAVFWLWAILPWQDITQASRCVFSHANECVIDEQDQYAAEDRLVHFLQQQLKPGERVEPYATSTLGPLFPALLRSQTLPSTPYLEGFPLYHDADTRYVQDIRADMLAKLEAHPPRFVIQPANFFAPGGAAASPFPALVQYYQDHYEQVDSRRYPELPETPFYTVYERKP